MSAFESEEKAMPDRFEVKTAENVFLFEAAPLIQKMKTLGKGIPLAAHKTLRKAYLYSFSGKQLLEYIHKHTAALPNAQDFLHNKQVHKQINMQIARQLLKLSVIEQLNNVKKSQPEVVDSTSTYYRLTKQYQRKVLVIGGGFGGCRVCKELEIDDYFDITLVDTKSYFEYLPSIPNYIENGEKHLSKIRVDYKKFFKRTKIIVNEVKRMTSNTITFKDGSTMQVDDYDYVVIATGSRYAVDTLDIRRTGRTTPAVIMNGMNSSDLQMHYKYLQTCRSITVIGTGPVGVEQAASLAVRFPLSTIYLISSASSLLERCCVAAHDVTMKFFSKYQKNVVVILGEKVEKIEDNYIYTTKRRTFMTEAVVVCTGFKPNTDFLTDGSIHTGNTGTTASTTAVGSSKVVVDTLLTRMSMHDFSSATRLETTKPKAFGADMQEPSDTKQEGVLSESQDITTLLHECCEKGLLESLKEHLTTERQTRKLALKSNYLDHKRNDCTLLHKASMHNHLKIMEFLLEDEPALLNAVDCLDATPLFYATARGCYSAASFLLSKSSPTNYRDKLYNFPLFLAIKNSNLDMANLLILFNADVNFRGVKGDTALHLACQEGSVVKAKFLLENHSASFAVSNRQQETPLMQALPHPELVDYLINYIIEYHPSKLTKWLQMHDYLGRTCIHICVENGHVQSLMHILCKLSNETLIKVLNERIANAHGETPLHLAVKKKDAVTTLLLCMTECVNVFAESSNRETALSLSAEQPMIKSLVTMIPQTHYLQYLSEVLKSKNEQLIERETTNMMLDEALKQMDCEIKAESVKYAPAAKKVKENSRRKSQTLSTSLEDTDFETLSALHQQKQLLQRQQNPNTIDMVQQGVSGDKEKQKLVAMISKAYSCSSMLDPNGYLRVNEYFQVFGSDKIFAVGDVTNMQEEKLAQAAFIHGKLLAQNIKRLEIGCEMAKYTMEPRKMIMRVGPNKAFVMTKQAVVLDHYLINKLKAWVEKHVMTEFSK